MARSRSSSEDKFAERSLELGKRLAHTRQQQQRTIAECAGIIKTTRRRYNAIERGEAEITAIELEVLLEHLGLSFEEVLQNVRGHRLSKQIVVQLKPGDSVRFIVDEQ